MTIGLEKFVVDVKNERVLWQFHENFKAEDKEAAWKKISLVNKMSVSHAKSIFNVLIKKYYQEKSKANSSWKLFQSLTFLDKNNKEETHKNEDDHENMEEDGEFIELLEVTEEGDFESKENSADEDNIGQKAKISNVIVPVKNKDIEKKEENLIGQADQRLKEYQRPQLNKVDSQQLLKVLKAQKQKHLNSAELNNPKTDLKKFPGLTILRSPYPPQAKTQKSSKLMDSKVSVKVINEENSTDIDALKKLPPFENFLKRKMVPASAAAVIENGKSQQLHHTNNEYAPPTKRISKDVQEKFNIKSTLILTEAPKQSATSLLRSEPITNRSEIDVEKTENEFRDGVSKLKSIPTVKLNNKKAVNDIKCKIAQIINSNTTSQSKNDFKKVEIKQELDSDNDSQETSTTESTNSSIEKKSQSNTGSKNDTLLPKFFSDLYKSKTYDSFGMYISSTLNRLPLHLAKKLEIKILHSILEINSLNIE